MKSNNFNVVNYVDNKPIYSYKYNVNDKKEIYSPQGRSVTINRNYLNVNPIKTINGENVTSQIDDSKNTLNVLVPIKFKRWKKQLWNLIKNGSISKKLMLIICIIRI